MQFFLFAFALCRVVILRFVMKFEISERSCVRGGQASMRRKILYVLLTAVILLIVGYFVFVGMDMEAVTV